MTPGLILYTVLCIAIGYAIRVAMEQLDDKEAKASENVQ